MWAPVILTLIFVSVGLLLMLVLLWAAWRHRNPAAPADTESQNDLKDFGPAETNRWIRGLRVFFLVLFLTVFGFHSYWVFWADSSKDSRFNRARRFDARNLRLAESALKGWVLDRSGKLENALIRYRSDGVSSLANIHSALRRSISPAIQTSSSARAVWNLHFGIGSPN